MKEEYIKKLASVCAELFKEEVKVELTRPEEQFGDYSTNVAMRLAGKLNKNPRDVAEQIIDKLKMNASIAGPGFINIRLSDKAIFDFTFRATDLSETLRGKTVVAEYSDPNPFKALHAGHLYTSLVGDGVSNLLETAGAVVKRVNFGGDVGLHVGKAMWAILQKPEAEHPEKLQDIPEDERAGWVSERYVEGHTAYTENDQVKKEITEVNKRVYQVHADQDKNSPFAQIYWTCRQWSYDGFDQLYRRLGMKPFDKYYPESAVDSLGLETIRKHTGTVYEESEGAIIFRGESFGLFTQVFVNSEGFTTYAGKDVGLIQQKYIDYRYDVSFIITDFSQKDHLSVVMRSIEQYEPELVAKTIHHTHGRINFADGSKMSSRSGNVVMANDVIDATFAAARSNDEPIILGAIRYSFLKNRIGGNIAYDPEESVAQEGNSGPYLQYALVRARSILGKVEAKSSEVTIDSLDQYERSLARKLSMYGEAFEMALNDYSPHHIAVYLYELAQIFNRFYENSRVEGDPREAIRVQLVRSYEKVLSHGLGLLGMPAPEKM